MDSQLQYFCVTLTLIDANDFPARVTVLGEHAVETGETIGPSLSHDIALTPKLSVALEASEVKHVPGSTLGLCALVR
jgi:hypothetical protein